MAVFTRLSDDALRGFAQNYDLGGFVRAEGILQGVENTNYHLFTAQGRYILTLIERRLGAQDLPAIIAYINHLAARGIPAAGVVADKTGATFRPLAGRPALVSEFLPGGQIETVTPDACFRVGGLLGAMHNAAGDFAADHANKMTLDMSARLIGEAGAQADGVAPGLAAHLADEIAFLKNAPAYVLPRGMAHLDLFTDNVFFRDGEISGVIDFYFSGVDDLAYDLIVTLNAWCFAGGTYQPECAAAFMKGYEAKRKLTAAERAALPLLGRRAALRFIATRLHAWVFREAGAAVHPKDPLEYVAILRHYQGAA